VKIYLVYSEAWEYLLRESNCRILYSYAGRDRGRLEPALPSGFPEILIDSGAYSLQTGRTTQWETNIKGYALWLQFILDKYPEVVGYFNLDCYARDAKRNLENQLYLESKGLKPIPVWHVGEEVEILDWYCNRYEIVGIGGNVSGHVSIHHQIRIWNWLVQRYPGQKFHYFGAGRSALRIFKSFRPYSTDNSSWLAPTKFGHMVVGNDVVLGSPEDREEIRKSRTRKDLELKRMIEFVVKLESEVERQSEPYQLILPL